MNIEEIVDEHNREIIKSIFSKLDENETYVILELNNQLQDKISKIDRAISYIYILKNNVKDFKTEYKEDMLNMLDDIGNILGGDKDGM